MTCSIGTAPAKIEETQSRLAKRLPMVGWYDPRQLAQTAVGVAISTIFGRHSDHRLVEAMASNEEKGLDFYDYSYHYKDNGKDLCDVDTTRPRDSIWIDYVADVGDGWNSTYAIAYYLAEPTRSFKYTDDDTNTEHVTAATRRGDILIFGGDEVYPTASSQGYKERLLGPYETALRKTDQDHPHVFAIPGNHDWYDSLVAFTRRFATRRWFAGWRTRQSRSYFALKLPQNWWLLGTDLQLGSDIDGPQLEYFAGLSKHMTTAADESGKPASVVLCHAEPHWIRAAQWGGIDPNYNESNVQLLERRLGKDVAVFLAGDLHHYRRHEAKDGSTQKITAGGGGAFLHPTHNGRLGKSLDHLIEKNIQEESVDDAGIPSPDRVFDLKRCFPSQRDSSRVCWRNLLFPLFIFTGNRSWSFGLAIAALYIILAEALVFRVDDPFLLALNYSFGNSVGLAIQTMVNSPLTTLLIAVTIAAFMFFTDTHRLGYRLFGGGIHAITHILTAFYIALLFVSLVGSHLPRADWRLPILWPAGFRFSLDGRIVVAALLAFLGGFVIGSFIMGIYLLISLNLFGRHSNEAFSSLGVEDWKNFLRLHIDPDGNLTIYPVGIRKVPRKWKPRESDSGPELVPDDAESTEPRLIEPPLFMKKAQTGTGVKKARFQQR